MVDHTIVEVEIPKHWQRFKVNGMSLERYPDEESIKLLKHKVESSTCI